MPVPPEYLPREVPRLIPAQEPEQLAPLDDIRNVMRTLNYGEFTAMARAMGADPDKAWAWACGG